MTILLFILMLLMALSKQVDADVVFTRQRCDLVQFGLQAIREEPTHYRQCGPNGRVWIVPCVPGAIFDPTNKVCKEILTTPAPHFRRKNGEMRQRPQELTPVSEFMFSTRRPRRPRPKTNASPITASPSSKIASVPKASYPTSFTTTNQGPIHQNYATDTMQTIGKSSKRMDYGDGFLHELLRLVKAQQLTSNSMKEQNGASNALTTNEIEGRNIYEGNQSVFLSRVAEMQKQTDADKVQLQRQKQIELAHKFEEILKNDREELQGNQEIAQQMEEEQKKESNELRRQHEEAWKIEERQRNENEQYQRNSQIAAQVERQKKKREEQEKQQKMLRQIEEGEAKEEKEKQKQEKITQQFEERRKKDSEERGKQHEIIQQIEKRRMNEREERQRQEEIVRKIEERQRKDKEEQPKKQQIAHQIEERENRKSEGQENVQKIMRQIVDRQINERKERQKQEERARNIEERQKKEKEEQKTQQEFARQIENEKRKRKERERQQEERRMEERKNKKKEQQRQYQIALEIKERQKKEHERQEEVIPQGEEKQNKERKEWKRQQERTRQTEERQRKDGEGEERKQLLTHNVEERRRKDRQKQERQRTEEKLKNEEQKSFEAQMARHEKEWRIMEEMTRSEDRNEFSASVAVLTAPVVAGGGKDDDFIFNGYTTNTYSPNTVIPGRISSHNGPISAVDSNHIIHFTSPPPTTTTAFAKWVTRSQSGHQAPDPNLNRPKWIESTTTDAPTRVFSGCVLNGDCAFSYDQHFLCTHPIHVSRYLQCTPMIGRRGRWMERNCPPSMVFIQSYASCDTITTTDVTPPHDWKKTGVKSLLPFQTEIIRWQENRELPSNVAQASLHPHFMVTPPETTEAFSQDLLPSYRNSISSAYFPTKDIELNLSAMSSLFPPVQPHFLSSSGKMRNVTTNGTLIDDIIKPVIKKIAMNQTEAFLDEILSDESVKNDSADNKT